MSKLSFLILFLFQFESDLFAQEYSVLDNLLITFEKQDGKVKIMHSQGDFSYSIIQRNITSTPQKVYTKLIWNDTISRFSNYYWVLYRKTDSGYTSVTHPEISDNWTFLHMKLHQEYGDKADSIFKVYDIERENLLPFKVDTLTFNLLRDHLLFDPGEYKFKVFFRVGNIYSLRNNKREITNMLYVSSDWSYFVVRQRISY